MKRSTVFELSRVSSDGDSEVMLTFDTRAEAEHAMKDFYYARAVGALVDPPGSEYEISEYEWERED